MRQSFFWIPTLDKQEQQTCKNDFNDLTNHKYLLLTVPNRNQIPCFCPVQFSLVPFTGRTWLTCILTNHGATFPSAYLHEYLALLTCHLIAYMSSSVFTSLHCEHMWTQRTHLFLQAMFSALSTVPSAWYSCRTTNLIYTLCSYSTSWVLLERQLTLPFHSCCEIPLWDHLQHETEPFYILWPSVDQVWATIWTYNVVAKLFCANRI